MRKVLLALGMGAFSIGAFAQPDKSMANLALSNNKRKDGHSKGAWTKGGLFSLNVAQGSSANWVAGAEKFSLSVNGYMNLFADKKWGKNAWDNNLDLSYGLLNTTSLGLRKNNDLIDFRSKYAYQIKKNFNFAALLSFRSQFADGFDYSVEPKRRISGWFAPAYITVAPGFEWKPNANFSLFVSPVAARCVLFTNKPYSYQYQGGIKPDGSVEKPLALNYGVDPAREVDFQFGAFVTAGYNKEIFKNVSYKSRLDLYSNYLQSSPLNIDVYWTNAIVMKVNSWLNVTYNIDVIYDDDIKQFGPNRDAPRTQYRSLLGIGVATRL
ncbi:MAG: DUF3078 domain-containing protein [Chitinophagaceae bacterium]